MPTKHVLAYMVGGVMIGTSLFAATTVLADGGSIQLQTAEPASVSAPPDGEHDDETWPEAEDDEEHESGHAGEHDDEGDHDEDDEEHEAYESGHDDEGDHDD